VLPGLAGVECKRDFLGDGQRLAHAAALPGVLRDNPFHLLALEALQKAPPQFAVHFTANRDDAPAALFAGECIQSHLAAVNDYRTRMEVVLPQLMDVVVTGCGGWPQDSTLADAVRSMVSASRILRPEGTLIVVAACDRGIGPPAFEKVLRLAQSPRDYFQLAAREDFSNPYVWLTHQYYKVLAHHEVIFCTPGIEADDLWKFGLTPAPELADAIHVAMENYGQDCRIAAIPEGWRTTVRTE
jgi:nickel-dependent lactate racemase